MLSLELARKYSRAILMVAEDDGKLEEYGKELKALNADIDGMPELKSYFSSPLIPTPAKKELAEKLFGGEISKMVANFFNLLLDKQRTGLLGEIATEYENYANEAQGIIVADVTTARPVAGAQEEKLSAKLAALTGKRVKLRKHLDPAIMGGMIVRMGDRRIDGSVRSRIEALGAQLMAE